MQTTLTSVITHVPYMTACKNGVVKNIYIYEVMCTKIIHAFPEFHERCIYKRHISASWIFNRIVETLTSHDQTHTTNYTIEEHDKKQHDAHRAEDYSFFGVSFFFSRLRGAGDNLDLTLLTLGNENTTLSRIG
jgi:hypothetical protein